MFAAGKDIARGEMELRVEIDNVVVEDAEYREYEDDAEHEREGGELVPA